LALAAANTDTVAIAKSSEEILTIRESGRTALILGFQNARSLERNVSALDTFYEAGVRVFALNHLAHNDFSDSSRPFHDPVTGLYEADAHGGLSPLGVAAIERINTLGGLVDVSQMSKAATLAAIAASRDSRDRKPLKRNARFRTPRAIFPTKKSTGSAQRAASFTSRPFLPT